MKMYRVWAQCISDAYLDVAAKTEEEEAQQCSFENARAKKISY